MESSLLFFANPVSVSMSKLKEQYIKVGMFKKNDEK